MDQGLSVTIGKRCFIIMCLCMYRIYYHFRIRLSVRFHRYKSVLKVEIFKFYFI